MKKITVVIAESGKFNDLDILPGTTASDVLKAIGLSDGYVLSSGKGQEPFGKNEVIYEAITDGGKCFASTPVEVGSGPLFNKSSFLGEICSGVGKFASSVYKHVSDICDSAAGQQCSTPKCFKTVASGTRVVERAELSYWQQRGWKKIRNNYSGYFRTKYGSFEGKATISPSGRLEMFIKDPPACLSKHSHWPCFMLRERGWYFIHNNRAGHFDLSSGLLDIENILTEAYQL